MPFFTFILVLLFPIVVPSEPLTPGLKLDLLQLGIYINHTGVNFDDVVAALWSAYRPGYYNAVMVPADETTDLRPLFGTDYKFSAINIAFDFTAYSANPSARVAQFGTLLQRHSPAPWGVLAVAVTVAQLSLLAEMSLVRTTHAPGSPPP